MKKKCKATKYLKNKIFKATIATIVTFALVLVNQSKRKIIQVNELKNDISGLQENLKLKEEEVVKANSEKQEVLNDIQELESNYTSLKLETDNITKQLDKKQLQIEILTEEIIGDKVNDIIKAIKEDEFEKISKYMHQEKGIRFSPITQVNIEKDKVIYKNLDELIKDKSKYDWGLFDANGNSILLTFEDYYKQYVKDEECIYSENIKYAKENVSKISMRLSKAVGPKDEIYKNALFADCVYEGTKDNNFADWKSIRFVFEEVQSVWYLTGIITNKG